MLLLDVEAKLATTLVFPVRVVVPPRDVETAADALATAAAAGSIIEGHQRVGECRGAQGVDAAAETIAAA